MFRLIAEQKCKTIKMRKGDKVTRDKEKREIPSMTDSYIRNVPAMT